MQKVECLSCYVENLESPACDMDLQLIWPDYHGVSTNLLVQADSGHTTSYDVCQMDQLIGGYSLSKLQTYVYGVKKKESM